MALYSDHNRLKLIKLVKYCLYLSVGIFIVEIVLGIFQSYTNSSSFQTGNVITSLVALGISVLIYKQLKDPKDNFWRKLAEIFGTIQIFCVMIIVILIILGIIALLYSVITGIPIDMGTQTPGTVTIVPITKVTTLPTLLPGYK